MVNTKERSADEGALITVEQSDDESTGVFVPASMVSAEHAISPSARIHPDKVIVDFAEARIPRSETAKRIAAMAKGSALVDMIKRSRSGAGALFDINPYDLTLEEGWNRRNFKTPNRRARIASWGVSIARVGVREPLVAHLKNGKICVHSGWNRWFATIYAIEVEGVEIQRIPVRFGKAGENDSDWNIAQLVNNGSDAYEPLEQAYVIRDQVNVFGWEKQKVADASGLSLPYVDYLLRLLELPQSILNYVHEGVIKPTTAKAWYKKCDEDEGKTVEIIEQARKQIARRKRTTLRPSDFPGTQRKPRRKKGEPDAATEVRLMGEVVDIMQRCAVTRVEGGRNIFITDEDYEILAERAKLKEIPQLEEAPPLQLPSPSDDATDNG